MKGRPTNRSRLAISVVVILSCALILTTFPDFSPDSFIPATPRLMAVGDNWVYSVTYPDGESFLLTESVIGLTELNGLKSFLLFRDDAQHISTEYLWITSDWREIQTFQPHIGNLQANSTVTYSPPLQLFQIPLKIGEKWQVNTSMTTITELQKSRIRTDVRLVEERDVQGMDEVSTPAGRFRAFRISTSTNHSLSETTWLDASMGQVVKAEYYNLEEEAVTQILVTYSEAPLSLSPTTTALPALLLGLDHHWKWSSRGICHLQPADEYR